MHFPRFWAKGTSDGAICWRWSDTSQADAQQQADRRAGELAALLASGQRLDRYSYGDRPLREEILEQQPGVAITRNLYGAVVLNAARVMFIDLDFEGDAKREPRALDQLRRWTGQHGLSVRAYRTAAGLRGLVTSATFDPKTSGALLREVGSDPLYVKLCEVQQSFRARLTPKPWRVALRPPRVRWPFEDAEVEREHRDWVARYDAASAGHAACRFVEAIGPGAVDAEVAPVLALHDQRACGAGVLA